MGCADRRTPSTSSSLTKQNKNEVDEFNNVPQALTQTQTARMSFLQTRGICQLHPQSVLACKICARHLDGIAEPG